MYAKTKYTILLALAAVLQICQPASAQYNSSLTGAQVESAINKVLATNAALVDINDSIWDGKANWLGEADQSTIDAMSPSQGDLVYNTTESDLEFYDGSAWQGLIGGDAGTDDQTASEVTFTPNGSISATDVQAAIQEVRDEAASGAATVATGVTASSTQSQGQGAQTADYVFVSTVASDNDVVTLRSASAGARQVIVNEDSSETLQVYPASGHNLGEGADQPTTIGPGQIGSFIGKDSSVWSGVITVDDASASETLTNKTLDADSNTFSNFDLGNEVDWAAADDVPDASAFESGDKFLIFEAGVGFRKADHDDLPSGGGSVEYSETFTILEPDAVQDIADEVALKKFVAESYPSGVTITSIHIDASAAYTSEIFLFEKWNDASGSGSATVEIISCSSISTEDDGTLSFDTIPADGFFAVNFDDTPEDVAYVAITISYTIN